MFINRVWKFGLILVNISDNHNFLIDWSINPVSIHRIFRIFQNKDEFLDYMSNTNIFFRQQTS